MRYIIENLTQYDLNEDEAATLIRMGFVHVPDAGEGHGESELVTTALTWDELGLTGDAAFAMFDAILGRVVN